MPHNVLIAGRPGIGKTALINRLYRDLTPLYIRGFYKEAIFENNILNSTRPTVFSSKKVGVDGPSALLYSLTPIR